MTTTAINLPLYRVLRALNVPDAEAAAAAEAPAPDLTALATRDELRAEAAKLAAKEELRTAKDELRTEIGKLATRDELRAEVAGVRAEIAQAVQRQTTWLFAALVAGLGLVIAAQRFIPQPLPTDAVRAIVAQTIRDTQAPAAPPTPPR